MRVAVLDRRLPHRSRRSGYVRAEALDWELAAPGRGAVHRSPAQR